MNVEFKDVVLYYKNLLALDNLSFAVREGAIYGLLGPNGSGKTTTLRVLLGLMKPSYGLVTINGIDVWNRREEIKRLVGYCPQSNSFSEKLTVKENIKYFAHLYDVQADLNSLAEEVSYFLGLYKKLDELTMNLSGGMKRRLNMACGILHKPELLILDEPSIGLDPISRNELWRFIKRIKSEGTTIILATNIMEEAEALCDRMILIKNGKALIEGNVNDIRSKGGNIENIIIYVKQVIGVDNEYHRIVKSIKNLEGVLDVEYTNEIIKVKVLAGYTDAVLKYTVFQLNSGLIDVEDVSIARTSLIDAFELLVGRT